MRQPPFLPMTPAEMRALGWKDLDVLFITGDAYVDHPAFGVALLGRWLVHHGFRVGIIAQPRWNDVEDITRMGHPRLFVGVTAGALDSQLAHYTAFRKKRHDDSYTPGGLAGARPNRACVVYANLARRAFPQVPLVLGGIEASLRRISHYDFWTDALRRSILLDAKADLLLYGMGERAIVETAQRCAQGQALTHIHGSVWIDSPETAAQLHTYGAPMPLPAHEDMETEPALLMDATLSLERQVHRGNLYAVQPVGKRALIVAPPAAPLSTDEMDALYALPFARASHPAYTQPIPAEEMLRTSITSHRGCGGGCSFCSLALHQGRRIASRSEGSILDEVSRMACQPKFSGAITDVGGPTANMWQGHCALNTATCRRVSCCHPTVCKSFITPQHKHVQLLRTIAKMPKIKHVRVASGIRADLALTDEDAVRAYTLEFTGGQLKVAPEHCSPEVLELMRKPDLDVFERFLTAFQQNCHQHGRQQFVIPYLMSAFPGCTDEHMRELAHWLAVRHWSPQQVQCFIPTPGTVATAMYYCGIDPHGNEIPVARTDADRLRQHRILMPNFGHDNMTPAARRIAAKKPKTAPLTPAKPRKTTRPPKTAPKKPAFPDFSRPTRNKG
ncbi:MAG: YgiQ family radical SAM protein [Desulfovibrionaceae bacterium]